MSADYDLPGSVTFSVLRPSAAVSSNSNTINFDLAPYQGKVGVVLNAGGNTAGDDANTKLVAAIYDSADNSSYAAISGATFTNVTNANSFQVYSLDTRVARRYMRVVMTVLGTNSSFPAGLSIVGEKQYNPS
jgi:hypothetical protein